MRSFATLARGRPSACAEQRATAPGNWRATPTQCAWHGALTMQRWLPENGAAPACVSVPATWWHWYGNASSSQVAVPLWNRAWRRQAIVQGAGQDAATRRISLLTQDGGGAWVATQWQWSPPGRRATRAWELRRWKLLERAVQALSDAPPPSIAEPLRGLGQRNLRGRPGELVGASLVWQADRQCLLLRAADERDDPGMPLPYAREDSRLEQRAAIQVQLARGAPGTTWPAPFHLMLPSFPRQRGATYAAIGRSGDRLIGRLWLPAKDRATLQRAVVEMPVPARPGTTDEARAVTLLDRELAALAALWTADHER